MGGQWSTVMTAIESNGSPWSLVDVFILLNSNYLILGWISCYCWLLLLVAVVDVAAVGCCYKSTDSWEFTVII
jgi:hypothetical protein